MVGRMKRSSENPLRDERLQVERQGNGSETAWIERIETVRGPRYLAIIACLEDAIRSGQLPSKTRLPPQRRLADLLGLTVGTTSRAYTIAAEAAKSSIWRCTAHRCRKCRI